VYCCLVLQSCLTLWDLMNCSLPGFFVCGISQARILEWVATAFSRGSSWLRDGTNIFCIANRFFTTEPWETFKCIVCCKCIQLCRYYYSQHTEYSSQHPFWNYGNHPLCLSMPFHLQPLNNQVFFLSYFFPILISLPFRFLVWFRSSLLLAKTT